MRGEIGEREYGLILQRGKRGVVEGRNKHVFNQIPHRAAAATMRQIDGNVVYATTCRGLQRIRRPVVHEWPRVVDA
jgi:hypothetical protein